MFFLEPGTALLFTFWSSLFDVREPLFQCAAAFLFELGDPLLRHEDAGMNAVDRLRHLNSFHVKPSTDNAD